MMMMKHGPGKDDNVVTARPVAKGGDREIQRISDQRQRAVVNTTALYKIPDVEMTKRLKRFAERLARILLNHSEADNPPALLHRISPQIPSVSCRLDTKNQRWVGAEMRLAWVGPPSVSRSELEELGSYLVQTYLGCCDPDKTATEIETTKVGLQLTHSRRFVCMQFDPASGKLTSTQNGLLFLRGLRRRDRDTHSNGNNSRTKTNLKVDAFSQTYALKLCVRRRVLQQHLTIVFKDGVGKERSDRKRKRISVAETSKKRDCGPQRIPRDPKDLSPLERPLKKIRI